MTTHVRDGGAPAWLGGTVEGVPIISAAPLGWGFRNETRLIRLTNGRRLAVTRLVDAPKAGPLVELMSVLQPRLADAGIRSPTIRHIGSMERGIIASDFIEGTSGAALLDTASGPSLVGSLIGTMWRALATIDVAGLPLTDDPGTARDLTRSSLAGRSTLSSRLGGVELDRLASRLAPVPGLLAGRRPGLVHGDLVPVNILVRERALAAALDFEFVRSADPLFDAAWFRWIVAWHHPRAGPSAWRSFVRASGLDAAEPGNRLLLRTLPLVRLVEILDHEELPDNEVPRWTGMLRACLRWADD